MSHHEQPTPNRICSPTVRGGRSRDRPHAPHSTSRRSTLATVPRQHGRESIAKIAGYDRERSLPRFCSISHRGFHRRRPCAGDGENQCVIGGAKHALQTAADSVEEFNHFSIEMGTLRRAHRSEVRVARQVTGRGRAAIDHSQVASINLESRRAPAPHRLAPVR